MNLMGLPVTALMERHAPPRVSPSRDRLDGEARAAAGVAVELGEDDARDAHAFVERLSDVDGVLTRHGVHR